MKLQRPFGISLLIIVLLFGLGLPVSNRAAQDEPGRLSVSGIVLTPGSREPRDGVMVELAGPDRTPVERNRGEKQQTIRTDGAGRFRFDGLPPASPTSA